MVITTTTTIPQQQQQLINNTIESSTTTMVGVVSDYEQIRQQRIKENRERLQKLGIVDLSLQLKSISSTASRRTTPKSSFGRKSPLKSPSVGPTEPPRRSSRLQNAPPVAYVEPKEEKSRRNRDIVLEVGSKPEFYTEEHEKLLGNTEMPWTCFVDGYAADGTRIYDPVKGKTCHQCRQKTLGQRTRCCQCNLVQGQFCGDCLYMRYGENVIEANQNPNWICPPCRGICNCSLCRQAKGWPATGSLYKKISRLGYKSVAHYLMATKRAPPEDTIVDTKQLAKRCLPFEGMQVSTDNASDEKARDENNVTHDTEPNQSPEESVMNGNKVVEDVVHVKKRPVGRPRKRLMEENLDTDLAVHVEKRPVGRPRKRLEDDNAGVVIHVEKRPIGRPRKRSMEENFDADVVHIKKRPIGRQRKSSMEENLNSDVEPLSTDVKKNELHRSTSVADNRSDDKATDESNANPDTEPNQTPGSAVNGEENLNSDEEPLSRLRTDVKKNELHSSTSIIDNASDDKATDESNANPDTEPNQTPKSVVNGEAAQDVLALVKKRPVGRPRKGFEKATAESNVNPDTEPNQTPKSVVNGEAAQDVLALVKKRPVGRPRKGFEKATAESNVNPDTEPNQTPKSVVNGEAPQDVLALVKKRPVGRPRKGFEKATAESNVNPDTEPNQTPKSVVNGEVAQDVLVVVKKRPVGRPRKGSEKENLNTGEEPLSTDVKKNGFLSEMQSPHSPTIVTDSVARRLRPRNKT